MRTHASNPDKLKEKKIERQLLEGIKQRRDGKYMLQGAIPVFVPAKFYFGTERNISHVGKIAI